MFGMDSNAWKSLPARFKDAVLNGSGDEEIKVVFKGSDSQYKYTKAFEGVIPNLERRLKETEAESVREGLSEYQRMRPCADCGGARLRKEARVVKVGGLPIHELSALSVRDAQRFFNTVDLDKRERLNGETALTINRVLDHEVLERQRDSMVLAEDAAKRLVFAPLVLVVGRQKIVVARAEEGVRVPSFLDQPFGLLWRHAAMHEAAFRDVLQADVPERN